MATRSYAVIGAGPSGLAVMRALQKAGIAATGFEASHGVG
jgi:cation diffusion facilitator CzcD-associated flavoprotein CzcO